MNLKSALLLLIALKTMPVFASKPDTVRLYYNIAEYELSSGNQLKLDSLCNSFKGVDNLQIIGYADYLGTGQANIILSQKRAEIVAAYIRLHKNLVITANGEGADMSTAKKGPSGEPIKRRVDVIINKVEREKRVDKPRQPDPQFANKITELSTIEVGGSLSLEELTFQGEGIF